ncbi:MAG: N-succinylarginine dihydrolase [Candidatus Omnitrophota bacterium]
MNKVHEVNFDGLIGPTHNFSGLAFGNIASMNNRHSVSHPRQAALEGLSKMKLVYSHGIRQGFIPPQTRPNVDILRQHGYTGDDQEIIIKAVQHNFNLLLTASSASSMWVANAATVTPSIDTGDSKVHITPANLFSYEHRSYESGQTYEFLKQIFPSDRFIVHPSLEDRHMCDEGAANHMRLCARHGDKGLHIFVYGKGEEEESALKYPARQCLAAAQQIIRNHRLDQDQVVLARQNPAVIEQGVFHNDVIAMSNENVFIFHEQAYSDTERLMEEIKAKFERLNATELFLIKVTDSQLTVEEAVGSYLFNSQLVTKPDGKMLLIAPVESEDGRSKEVIENILHSDNPVDEVKFVSLKQSMLNGGGPACLRLRVPLTDDELEQVNPGFLLDDRKFRILEDWVVRHYRATLEIHDFKSTALFQESKKALEELVDILSRENH